MLFEKQIEAEYLKIEKLMHDIGKDFIDEYLAAHASASVDYIHGEESVRSLSKQQNAIGFLFSGMEKSDLFRTVIFDGALPRKTFSMGHAQDKRYYMECRAITKA